MGFIGFSVWSTYQVLFFCGAGHNIYHVHHYGYTIGQGRRPQAGYQTENY